METETPHGRGQNIWYEMSTLNYQRFRNLFLQRTHDDEVPIAAIPPSIMYLNMFSGFFRVIITYKAGIVMKEWTMRPTSTVRMYLKSGKKYFGGIRKDLKLE